VRIGVILPTFAWDASAALEMADRSAAAGIDGVFAYDHLWPMRDRSRPALAPFPVLAAIAGRLPALFVGPLVARIGLVADEVLCSQFAALEAISPGRVIAAVGTGDSLSAEENLAYGIDFAPAAERRAHLAACAQLLSHRGLEVWIGGGAAPTLELAASLGAVVNLWQATPEAVAAQAASTAVSWGGTLPEDDGDARALLRGLDEAGATWAVVGGVEDPLRLLELAAG
jgi:alkanesulfonate monooxygenase SsuD/methylene tetrahydromethanopterin reductase-like flavin-dependent oxidoreductase (luciferase family)